MFDGQFERVVIFTFTFLDAHDDVAVHLNESAVAVPGESLVAGGIDEALNRVVIQAKVEDGIHHTGHGVAGAGADGDQQRHGGFVAEFGAHDGFDLGDTVFDLSLKDFRILTPVVVKVCADFG